ncbi:MAG: hypothetical protein K2K80_05325, partial [Clostridia bacterium]|nr:hypothetical protein [Clostridia bacterium]
RALNNAIRRQRQKGISAISYSGFSVDVLENNKSKINLLRRRVAHNKIILEGEKEFSAAELLSALYETLPISYQSGFRDGINGCKNRLKVPKSLIIKL